MARLHGWDYKLQRCGEGYGQPQKQSTSTLKTPCQFRGSCSILEVLTSQWGRTQGWMAAWPLTGDTPLGWQPPSASVSSSLQWSWHYQLTGSVSFKMPREALSGPSTNRRPTAKHGPVTKSKDSGPSCQCWNAGSATHLLCDFGEVT